MIGVENEITSALCNVIVTSETAGKYFNKAVILFHIKNMYCI